MLALIMGPMPNMKMLYGLWVDPPISASTVSAPSQASITDVCHTYCISHSSIFGDNGMEFEQYSEK